MLAPPLVFLCLLQTPAPPRPVFIEDLTTTEVREAIAGGATTALVYAGSTEQNGPHLVIGKHLLIARWVAERVARELGNALVYPVIPFAPTGDAERRTGHMAYPGSVSLAPATFAAVVHDVARSAIAAGFKYVALLGDHGDGQDDLARVARQLDAVWRPRGVRVLYIGDAYSVERARAARYLAQHHLPPDRHAGLDATSELLAIDSARAVRGERIPDAAGVPGVDGDPRGASAELGRMFLQWKVDAAVAEIRRLLPPPR
ncbi:MAG TPA: creatininase family protein [Gemmatimonadales bacterium]|nr:creatininase family protein [Gemmatimonadales bacterium]